MGGGRGGTGGGCGAADAGGLNEVGVTDIEYGGI